MAEYIYLVREREFIKTNEEIYKIGRSKQTNCQRISSYPKGSMLILTFNVNDCCAIEKEIIELFKKKFKLRKDIGNEYFEGNKNLMITLLIPFMISNEIQEIKPDNTQETTQETTQENTQENTPESIKKISNILSSLLSINQKYQNSFISNYKLSNECKKYYKNNNITPFPKQKQITIELTNLGLHPIIKSINNKTEIGFNLPSKEHFNNLILKSNKEPIITKKVNTNSPIINSLGELGPNYSNQFIPNNKLLNDIKNYIQKKNIKMNLTPKLITMTFNYLELEHRTIKILGKTNRGFYVPDLDTLKDKLKNKGYNLSFTS
jgi:hypothetical protein